MRHQDSLFPSGLPPTFGGGAVNGMQAQFLIVQMCRQFLEEGGGACDCNIAGAANEYVNSYGR